MRASCPRTRPSLRYISPISPHISLYLPCISPGELPEDATITFAHFYSRFGAYIPQVMSGHQVAHAYGARARHSLPSNPNPHPNPNP